MCLDDGSQLAVTELAAVIVDDSRPRSLALSERCFQLRRDGTTRQVDQQSMVDHIPTVRVDKRQQEVVPTADPGVHHVGVPLLIRPRLLEGVDAARPRRALPPVQQVRLA